MTQKRGHPPLKEILNVKNAILKNERVEETHGPQFKKYNKLQSLRTVIRIISQKPFNYRLFEHFPDQTSNKKSSNHHLIDYHIP